MNLWYEILKFLYHLLKSLSQLGHVSATYVHAKLFHVCMHIRNDIYLYIYNSIAE